MTLRNTLVVIPTFNEIESLPGTISRLLQACPQVHVLVVDDNSPDGTGDWAEDAAKADPRISVLHRAGKEGLGKAYLAAFAQVLAQGWAHFVVELDADGSHQPEELPKLLVRAHAGDNPDLVIGARWVPGGSVRGWAAHRESLSRMGNAYIRLALGMEVHDATAGFRVYAVDFLRGLALDDIATAGYGFQVEMTRAVVRAGGTVAEVPICFVERAEGVSKMSGNIISEALLKVTRWGIEDRIAAW